VNEGKNADVKSDKNKIKNIENLINIKTIFKQKDLVNNNLSLNLERNRKHAA